MGDGRWEIGTGEMGLDVFVNNPPHERGYSKDDGEGSCGGDHNVFGLSVTDTQSHTPARPGRMRRPGTSGRARPKGEAPMRLAPAIGVATRRLRVVDTTHRSGAESR